MLKKILAIVAMLYAAVAFAAVDVNKATAAELDGIKGIGPGISTKILDERKKGNFKDWNDFIERVKGIGETNAAKFSAEGMTVNGQGFKGVAAAAKKDDKPAAKAEAKPAAAAAAARPEPGIASRAGRRPAQEAQSRGRPAAGTDVAAGDRPAQGREGHRARRSRGSQPGLRQRPQHRR